MKFKDYTWDKEFEIKGYFSEIPEDIVNEHDSLSGILHYSPSEIVLELFGAFEVESRYLLDLESIWRKFTDIQATEKL